MSKIRRINLYGGAGSGKSLTACNIKSQLGFKGYDIELVEEVIKDWTYIPRIPKSTDSFYLHACQVQKEDIRLRAGVKLIVTDSPLLLQYFYSYWHDEPLQSATLSSAMEFEKLYPSLNLIIEREDSFYNEVGRYETLKEAKKIDDAMEKMLKHYKIKYRAISCLDQRTIINHIVNEIGKPS